MAGRAVVLPLQPRAPVRFGQGAGLDRVTAETSLTHAVPGAIGRVDAQVGIVAGEAVKGTVALGVAAAQQQPIRLASTSGSDWSKSTARM